MATITTGTNYINACNTPVYFYSTDATTYTSDCSFSNTKSDRAG